MSTATKLTLLLGNGSIHVLHEGPPSPNLPCTILLLIFTSSLLLNSLVLFTIMLSTLRSTMYNALLAYLSATGVIEAVVNVTVSVAVRAAWRDMYRHYGREFVSVLCRTNAFMVQLVDVLLGFILAVGSAERVVALNVSSKQSLELEELGSKGSTLRSLARLTPATALLALAVVLPGMAGLVDTRLFERRYACSPAYATEGVAATVCSVVLLLAGYLLPWLLTARSWIVIARSVHNERRRLQGLELVARQRAAERRSPVRGLGSSVGASYTVSWSHVWGSDNDSTAEGYRYFMLLLSLVLLYLLFVVPSILLVQVFQFHSGYALVPDETFYYSNSTGAEQVPEELLAVESYLVDTVVTWARFLFFVVTPLVILSVHKEVRSQCFKTLFCFTSRDSRPSRARSVSAYLQECKEKRQRRKNSIKIARVADFKTPVLFASSEGLYLRQFQANNLVMGVTTNTQQDQGFSCEFTDLALLAPQEKLAAKRLLPRLSQTPPSVRSLRIQDESEAFKEKKGKCVRFAQRISEIPLSESGIYSSEDAPTPTDSTLISIQPPKEAELIRALPNRVSFDRLQEKRLSDTFIKFPNMADIGARVSRDRAKSLELDLVQHGTLNSSSTSLLLSLSQRMRNRNS